MCESTLAKMAEHGPFISEPFCDQIREFPQIRAELLGRNRGGFPTKARHFFVRNTAGADAGFTRMPQCVLIFWLFEKLSFMIAGKLAQNLDYSFSLLSAPRPDSRRRTPPAAKYRPRAAVPQPKIFFPFRRMFSITCL